MYRKFCDTLSEWYKKNNRKPMLVVGARQTGKTWQIEEFCKNSKAGYFKVNLEEQKEYLSAFEGNLSPEDILGRMEMLSGQKIDRSGLIFIDEIQESELAITALKYFCEAKEDYHVIGAGSLLGVKLSRFGNSFPVGKVEIYNMYPMDFEEFLIASDESILRDGIRTAYMDRKPLPDGIHKRALQLYMDYLFVGGMPELVKEYLSSGKNVSAMNRGLMRDLVFAYKADMTKYTISAAEGVKITEVYDSIPKQLARDNPKFKYKDVRPMANKRDFSSSLDWLAASGMINRVTKLDAVMSPIKGYEDKGSIKVYMSDVGILTHSAGLRMRDMMPDVHNIYKGGVTENYVVQQFAASGKNLNYYKPSESMEIDLVLDTDDGIIPVEIKSGRHRRSTSLKNYREKYSPAYAVRISENNFGEIDGLISVPLYAAWLV